MSTLHIMYSNNNDNSCSIGFCNFAGFSVVCAWCPCQMEKFGLEDGAAIDLITPFDLLLLLWSILCCFVFMLHVYVTSYFLMYCVCVTVVFCCVWQSVANSNNIYNCKLLAN